jgi:hypothetical protein
MGGVSAAFRRLPQQAGTNPAVRCCRNSANGNGTLSFTQRNYATWPRACEALCDAHPSGRCHYFSHSFRNFVCILCESCQPEILLGDDTFASFQRVTEEPTTLYDAGVLARR